MPSRMQNMSFGWSGRILRVDLSCAESWTEDTAPYARSFVGGKGINLKTIYDEVGLTTSAFDPENLLCFGPGVLTGTLAPAAGRMKVSSLSPDGLVASSGIGGFAGAEIRHAGYDSLVIQGRAEEPVYLYVRDALVEIREAAHLWGLGTQETQQVIKEEVGDQVSILCIGHAGEELVTFSGILTGMGSVAGRHGLGAVMGSKQLKAIAIQGTLPIRIAKLEEFTSACLQAQAWLRQSPAMQMQAGGGAGDRHTLGYGYDAGAISLGNWEEDTSGWDDTHGFDGGDEFWTQYAVHQYGCIGCPVNHFHVFRVPDIGTGVTKCAGWISFAGNVWNCDRKVMFHANQLCNHYGLDVVSTGGAISFLMELHHRGILTARDTDGMSIRRGEEKAIISTIHKIGKQEGFGRLFRNGLMAAAREIGPEAEACAMVVHGEAIEPYEVRAYKSEALAAALSAGNIGETLGVDFGYVADPEGAERYAEQAYGSKEAALPTSYQGKALSIWDYENTVTACDLVGTCAWVFTNWIGGDADTPSLAIPAKLFYLATGLDSEQCDLLLAAQRCKTLERAFNVSRGVRRAHDTLPKRLFETAVPGGRFKGERLDRASFEKMLDQYYALRSWDEKGIPTQETFAKLGLSSEYVAFKQALRTQKST